MPLDAMSLDSLSEDHLQRLVLDKEQENKIIEFKLILPGNGDSDRKEFLADFTSFANTGGGNLIYGIRAPQGIAEEVVGIDCNLDAETNRLENLIRTGAQPRILGFSYGVKAVPLKNGNGVLIFKISRSWALPHRVTLGSHDKFYGRNSSGKYALDVPELRSLFLISESRADRIRDFLAERVSSILSNRTPVPMQPGPKTVIHVVPFNAFDRGHVFDVSRTYNNNFLPLSPIYVGSGLSYRHNFDGIVTYSVSGQEVATPSYLQLFRSGIIESVDSRMIGTHDGAILIPGRSWEDRVLAVIPQYFSVQANIGIAPPVVLMISLLNVKGGTIYVDRFSTDEDKVDRDHLLTSEVIVESFDSDLGQLLKPAFDVVWNACGYPGSMSYGDDGKRKSPR